MDTSTVLYNVVFEQLEILKGSQMLVLQKRQECGKRRTPCSKDSWELKFYFYKGIQIVYVIPGDVPALTQGCNVRFQSYKTLQL